MMGQITEDFVQRAMRCCQLGQHPSLTVWETRQLLTAWVEWQGCRDERDKLDEANRICEQWRQWTVATRAENEALRARVAELEKGSDFAADALRVVERRRDELKAERNDFRAKLGAITVWLEANQPDVFRRGLWDAIRCAGNKDEGAK